MVNAVHAASWPIRFSSRADSARLSAVVAGSGAATTNCASLSIEVVATSETDRRKQRRELTGGMATSGLRISYSFCDLTQHGGTIYITLPKSVPKSQSVALPVTWVPGPTCTVSAFTGT